MFIQLKRIELKNFRCFRELSLPLLPDIETSVPDYQKIYSNLTVLVAKNGEGKTAVLEAISYLLGCMISRFPQISVPKFKDSDYRQEWTVTPNGLKRSKRDSYMRLQAFAKTSTSEEITWDMLKKRDASEKVAQSLPPRVNLNQIYKFADGILDIENSNNIREELYPVIAYYNTQRAVIWKKPERRRLIRKKLDQYDGYKGALEGHLNYKYMIEWISLIEDEQRKERERLRSWDYVSKESQTIQLAIEKLLPGYRNLRVETKPLDLAIDYCSENGQVIKSDRIDSQLSDGYKTVLVLLLDIVSRILRLNSDVDNITPERLLQSPGIVLIDEIDLHLHPFWQQRVLHDLVVTFPNIQFIVSTHSPQVISGIPKECVRIFSNAELLPVEEQTQGVETDTILASIFGTEASIQDLEIVQDYNTLLEMLAEQNFSGEAWDALYQKVEKHYGKDFPPLLGIKLHKDFLSKRKQ